MPEFPIPNFGEHIETILGYAVDWLNMLDDQRFLWIIAVFSLVLMAVLWIIKTVRNPPSLDI